MKRKKRKSYSQVIKETPGLVEYWPLDEWWTIQDWILVDGKWHHLAVVMPSNRVPEIYVDGARPLRECYLSAHNKVFTPKELERLYKKGL